MNKARLMAVGMLFISFSCLMTGAPYAIYGKNSLDSSGSSHGRMSMYNLTSNITRVSDSSEYCSSTGDSQEDCSAKGIAAHATVWLAYCIIFMASFLNGIGYTVFYTLGLPYMDDNLDKRKSPLYFSALTCVRFAGPACGYALSSWCLSMYENPFEKPDFDTNDPRWIGAWWIGFLVIGCLIFIASLPLFLLPAQIRDKKAIDEDPNAPKLTTAQDVKASLLRLATNKMLVFDTLSRIMAYIGYGGYYVTQTKYIESQYSTSASKSSRISGTVTVSGMAIGTLLGGVFIWLFKPGPRAITSYVWIVGLGGMFGMMAGVHLGCPVRSFHGLDTLTGSVDLARDGPMCSHECACSQRVFQPVCSPDGETNYFSPCFAGCTEAIYGGNLTKEGKSKVSGYGGCACEPSGSVTAGYCKTDCGNNFGWYMAALAAGKTIASLGFTGNIVVRNCVFN